MTRERAIVAMRMLVLNEEWKEHESNASERVREREWLSWGFYVAASLKKKGAKPQLASINTAQRAMSTVYRVLTVVCESPGQPDGVKAISEHVYALGPIIIPSVVSAGFSTMKASPR